MAGIPADLKCAWPLLFHTFDVTIEKLDTHPLFDQLGLQRGQATRAYECEMDFTIEAREVLWPGPS